MTALQPFTTLCQALTRKRLADRADLHVHTTCSDGAYSPAQVVDLAQRSGLAALAITDHDTTDALAPARRATGTDLELVAGVEISAIYRGREFHLLGYFFRVEDGTLQHALANIRARRAVRFEGIRDRLQRQGIDLPAPAETTTVLGRRHVAEMLVQARRAGNIRQAFARFLPDSDTPRIGLPVADAIAVVRGAGGVAAWAHPPYDCTQDTLAELKSLGLQAVEVEYPAWKRSRCKRMRAMAAQAGLAVTGGSDCHGPGARGIGACSIAVQKLDVLRHLASENGARWA